MPLSTSLKEKASSLNKKEKVKSKRSSAFRVPEEVLVVEIDEEEMVELEPAKLSIQNESLTEEDEVDTKDVDQERGSIINDDDDIQLSNNDKNSDDQNDDEIILVKANIYKYQGHVTESEEVSDDVFRYRHEVDYDEDDIMILDDDNVANSNEDFEEIVLEEENVVETLVKCSECHAMFREMDLENHKLDRHPPLPKVIKQFENGNFFMIAS